MEWTTTPTSTFVSMIPAAWAALRKPAHRGRIRQSRFCDEYSYFYHAADGLIKSGSTCGWYIADADDPNAIRSVLR